MRVAVTMVRDRKIQTALRTNQINIAHVMDYLHALLPIPKNVDIPPTEFGSD